MRPKEYRFEGRRLVFSHTLIMGIINVTPDSFSDGGAFFDPTRAVEHARALIRDGADILDIGGESSRPGADVVPEEEELNRVIPVIKEISRLPECPPISIDSYKPSVARQAIEAGATIINDISGLRDPVMADLAAETDLPVIIMHMKGDPRTMQRRPRYKDVVVEIVKYFKDRLRLCEEKGIEKIILDPGIGFGKSVTHNLQILKRLDEIKALGHPVLIGLSRKSIIGKTISSEGDNLETGTVAGNVVSIVHGADIIRVHDVARNRHAARMTDSILKGKL